MVISRMKNLKEDIESTGDSESQAIEGYACTCGKTFDDLNKFKGHMLTAGRQDKGEHSSRGRINLETGEITMPPANERTQEQWQQAKYGKKPEIGGKSSGKSSTAGKTTSRPIDNIAGAVQVKFVPRVYTIDYSPILRMAQDAAIKYFGWRDDMPFGNFLDTVIYLYFKDKGITLAGYVVEENLQEEFIQERQKLETRRSQSQEPLAISKTVPSDVLESIRKYNLQKEEEMKGEEG